LQGLAVGGQWGGAMLLAIENAPKGQRGFYGSFAQIGVPVGVVLANLAFLVLAALIAPEAFQAWGWRIPFLLSIVMIGLALYIQLKLEDTPAFRKLAESDGGKPAPERSPVLQVLRSHPRQILLAGGAFIASNGCFYINITYSVAYATATLHLERSVVLAAVLIGSLTMIPLLLLFASLSDRWGRRGLFMAGAALSGLWAFAFFPLLQTGSLPLIILAEVVALAVMSMMYGPQAAFFAELFSTKVRYSGASMGYQLGAILGGGFAPIVATALFAEYGSTLPISAYMAALCVISFVSVLLLTETHMADVDDAQTP
jgi:MFS family permease